MLVITSSLESWKLFNFLEFQRDLDKTAHEIASRQDSADVSRKHLVNLSKEFRSTATEEAKKMVGPLLKSFQAEVDSLSKRSKKAEAEYLTLYNKLIDLPDPTPALEKSVAMQKQLQRIGDLEIENNQLRETLDEFKAEFAHVKNQEVTLKQLRDRIRELEESMEENVNSRLRDRERELNSQFSDRERILNEHRLDAGKRISEMEQKVRTLQQALSTSQTETFDMKTKFEEALNAKVSEVEMLAGDLDRVTEQYNQGNEELASVRLQLQQLIDGDVSDENDEKLTSVKTSTEIPQYSKRKNKIKQQLQEVEEKRQQAESRIWELEMELSSREKEVGQLVDDLRRNQAMMQHLSENDNTQILHLENEVKNLRQQTDQLRQQLQNQSDYNDLKREVDILRSVEFGSQLMKGAGGNADDVETKSLDHLLAEKNRALQNELTQTKVANETLQNRLQTREKELTECQLNLAKSHALIHNLEDDLRQVRTLSLQFRGNAEGQDNSLSTMRLQSMESNSGNNSVVDYNSMEQSATTTTTVFSEADFLSQLVTSPDDLEGGGDKLSSQQQQAGINTSSLLSIVQNQRERFRSRAQELESQTISQQQQIHFLQTEMDKLRADNVKLYEKVRFLQSYAGNKKAEEDTTATVMERYSGEYEERLNPFNKFSKRERQRKYENLRAHDKIALSMGRMIFNNPMARMFAFLYTVFLHLLVFLVLYKLAHTESCKRDLAAECEQKFAEHMMHSHSNSKL